jgi:hypothetical protein
MSPGPAPGLRLLRDLAASGGIVAAAVAHTIVFGHVSGLRVAAANAPGRRARPGRGHDDEC